MNKQIEIRAIMEAALSYWPLFLILILCGALLGYAIGLRNPPLYQAIAVMAVGLDFDREPPIKQYEQDLAEGKIVAYIQSDEVSEAALERFYGEYQTSMPLLEVKDFISMTSIHRMQSQWHLIVIHIDPVVATSLANAWAITAEEALWEAYGHAMHAVSLQRYLNGLLDELAKLEVKGDESPEIVARKSEIKQSVSEAENLIQDEIQLSHSIVTFMTFDLTNLASVPEKPVARAKANVMLAGSAIGLAIGLMLVIIVEVFFRGQGAKPREVESN